jgi:choline dehydrogenase-like flavoprotein
LANSSGLVGKFFMQHFGASSKAIFSERIDSFRGFYGGAISEDLPKTASENSFVRGFRLDLVSGDRGPVKKARDLMLWGKQLKDYMRKNFGYVAGINAAAEQLPYERNCVGLDPEVKDIYGMPAPRISFEWGRNIELMMPAIERTIRNVLDAAGATEILNLSYLKPGRGAHNGGTCRMGNNPQKSVLNSFCQSHDISNLFVIDGSCFVTMGIANPSLTIQAIAVRASEYIVEQAKRGNL